MRGSWVVGVLKLPPGRFVEQFIVIVTAGTSWH